MITQYPTPYSGYQAERPGILPLSSLATSEGGEFWRYGDMMTNGQIAELDAILAQVARLHALDTMDLSAYCRAERWKASAASIGAFLVSDILDRTKRLDASLRAEAIAAAAKNAS